MPSARAPAALHRRRTRRVSVARENKSWWERVVSWFYRHLVQRTLAEGDTLETCTRKQSLVVAVVGCGTTAAIGSLPFTSATYKGTFGQNAAVIYSGIMVAMYAWMCITKRASVQFMTAYAAATALMIACADVYAAASFEQRSWPFCVILLDILLICDAPEQLTLTMSAAVVLWIVFTQLEYLLRFGLFDLPGLEPYDDRRSITDCTHPPCARGDGFAEGTLLAIFVFVMDFTLTRGFKRQVRAQQLALHDSMAVAREVAYALAEYDLDAAERYLDTHGGRLPEGWQPIYGELLTNLRAYKPYLPDALFRSEVVENDAVSVGGDSMGSTSYSGHRGSDAGTSGISTQEWESQVSHGTPCSQGLRAVQSMNAIPPMSRIRVDDKKVSLLTAALDVDPNGATDTYPRDHSAMLAQVIDAVKAHRGSVDYFHGERVYASFNAFRPCYTHPTGAVAAAVIVCGPERRVFCAIATGLARVGTLGTPTMLSPSIVGCLPRTLVAMQDAGPVVGEPIVCNRVCYEDASVQYPMRVLLHKMDVQQGQRRAQPVVMHCLDCDAAEVLFQTRAGDGQEWMYEMAAGVGDTWGIYNEAGRIYHAQGLEAATRHLYACGADADIMARFARDAEAARHLPGPLGRTGGDAQGADDEDVSVVDSRLSVIEASEDDEVDVNV